MDERERAMRLLEAVPECKMKYVVTYLQAVTGITEGEDESGADTNETKQIKENYK